MLRPLFLSHGAPTLPLEDVAARYFLEGLAPTIPRPRAILVVSAHWETRIPTVNAVEKNETIQSQDVENPPGIRQEVAGVATVEMVQQVSVQQVNFGFRH